MSENTDSLPNNLCIPVDAFEQFQAVSMYQEEEYITLPVVVSPTPKEPDPGEISHLHYDNEVVVSTEDEVNSTVVVNTPEMESEMEIDDSCVERSVTLDDTMNNDKTDGITNLDQDYEPLPKVSKRGRRKKNVIENDSNLGANVTVLGSKHSNDLLVEQESPLICSTEKEPPRKRGRKPKPKPVPPESVPPLGISQDHLNISNTPFSSDPENSSIVTNVKRKRGRPRKVSVQNDQNKPITSDREVSSELSSSDTNRIDDVLSPRKRGRPRKSRPETNLQSPTKYETDNELISIEDLNGTQPTDIHDRSKELLELDISKIENTDLDNKILGNSVFADNDDLEDVTLSKLKEHPETTSEVHADKNHVTENDKDHNLTNTNLESTHPSVKKSSSRKKRQGKPKKGYVEKTKKDQVQVDDKLDSIVASTSGNHLDNTQVDSDDNDDLCLSQLKEVKNEIAKAEDESTTVVSTTAEQDIKIEIELEANTEINGTPTKRNSKMPVMSDFEYNVDSVLEKEVGEHVVNADNDLLVEDTSKRPVRRKVPKLRYDEESDEDPFANIELSDDDEPRRRKGHRYYSDDEYVPGRRGNKDIDSTDSEVGELIYEGAKHKKRKSRKKSENQSPRKKGKLDKPSQDVDNDVEICEPPSEVKASDDSQSQPSKQWGCSDEFESFLAKKIQGTNLKIKKVSSVPTENKTLEIPVIDPEAKKTVEMCSQTSIIRTTSTAVQTSMPYDIPMKENITLTPEQAEKACNFLNSIVKTTSELGTLMTQKSEDFMKKKINTTHVTDTMKMDYCVKKSFLLFKLAKHNLMQMEEDLAKEYEEFLQTHKLTSCREVPKQIAATVKQEGSDSDCEIVEEPVKVTEVKSTSVKNKSKEKPKFNPKTVFLNKELSIKIAKKPTENKKLDIKGRHTVWINDTVMVKKVKPTQSFLAQDSRNKKPPDNKITTKMVSDFFKNYYRQKAISVCAPFITRDWLNMGQECVCNYFVVEPIKFNNANYSASVGINTETNASTSETRHALKQIPNNNIVTCPESLLKLCFRIVKNRMHDKSHVKEVCQYTPNEITDGKNCEQIPNNNIVTCPESLFKLCFRIVKNRMHDKSHVKEVCQYTPNDITDEKNREPVTLFRQSLRVLTGRAVDTMVRSPSPSEIITPNDISTVLPLKKLCYIRMVELLSTSDKNYSKGKQENAETRCSMEDCNDLIPTYSSKYSSSAIKINEMKSLLSLCVEFIQEKIILESSYFTPKPLKTYAYENVKQLMYKDLEGSGLETSKFNLNEHNDGIMIEGLTINSVNTLSEEAFLRLEQSHGDNLDSSEYDFDNEDHYEPDFNEIEEEENHTEASWASQVQMKEFRSCFNNTITDENERETVSVVTRIKVEPLDETPENIDSLGQVKTEPIPVPDEMTVIPDVKPEVLDHIVPGPIQRQDSNSYDVDAFEQFVATNKLMHEFQGDDIYSQSGQRIRRQHEPDYEEEDFSMSLLVPQTYEPLTIETAKGRLMESSSDEDSSKNKKSAGKKKPDKRNKGKQKKTDPKITNKEIPTLATKDKPTNNEVANLTKKMRDRIRQEEKKDDSSDSEIENLPLRLRSRKEQEKTKHVQSSKAQGSEIQCNNVDSTDQVEDDVGNFTGFTAIDQNEISTYQKYMKYVYDKIIPGKEEEISKLKKNADEDISEKPLISNEPVELLECEPTMPVFEDQGSVRKSSRRGKGKVETPKKEELVKKDEYVKKEETSKKEKISKKAELATKEESSKKEVLSNEAEKSKEEEVSKKGVSVKKEHLLKETVANETPSFIDRHGWHCYPVNIDDGKLYQNSCVALEKLPESFVQTYFEYQGITCKNVEDQEIDRLTNLNSLNRAVNLQNLSKTKLKSKRDAKGENTLEAGSRPDSPSYSDHYDELEPSEDEGANVEDEVAPPVVQKHTENTLAKNLLMNDNDSDSDGTLAKVKREPTDGTEPKSKITAKSKKKGDVIEDGGDLMLTADKMMNKELKLLHAPVVVTAGVPETPIKGPVTRNKQKSATKNQSSSTKTKNEEDSSSEEEKQWVSTKEKLLKRMGKKDQTSVDDAKRAKLVSEFIERRGERRDSHMRSRTGRPRRSAKKFLERQKQLGILSRELFGESSDTYMSKRSQASLYKGRRNIRKVIDKKSLARSTVVANMEEFERKRRLNARQTKLRELLGCEEGVNVLVINDEVCLEYDFEQNRPVVTVHPFFTKVMKAHQYEGVKFMWDACFESLAEIEAGKPGGGCILAHCMGLGKTLQVLALLHTVLTHPGVNMQRVLVCCPLSTVLNWVDEIHKWIGPVTNQIKVFELSKLKKTYERAYQLEDWYNGGGIFIIGYELFRSLTTLDPFLDDVRPTIINKIRTALLDPGPDIIVCDEGHLLKNDCSVLAVAMSRVVTKRRIILTGTPMQNNLREYYCMVNFVKPNLLGTYAEYSNRFENPIMNGQHRDSREEDIKLMKARTHILHKVLEGCLQRQEASVLYPYLPKKHEYTVFITLTPCQWDLYKHYLSNYGKQSKQSILKDFHILQKIWSHPQVLHNFQTKARDRDEKNKIKAEKLEDDLATEDLEEIKPNASEDLWWLEYLDGGNMLETLDSSNKFVVVFRILDECVALGDKVLIFSTSLFCLDALEYFLKKIKKWSLGNEYYRLDGSVPAEVRQKWCREFNADNNVKTKLFLVSTRAGCLGLNMTAANRVIIMDTSWNPAHDIQSIFRVYRFGQKKDCYIYRLVAMGTMEQKIYERSVTKQAVACRVVDEQQIDRHYNMAELTELYKYDEGGSCVAGGVAVGVRDVALLRVARDVLLHAVHEHDSLLRGSSEQGLPEHERNAAWMQFQQEQAHKQIENKLVMTIPNVQLKRLHDVDAQATPSTTNIKKEDSTEDFTANEPKTKKGKKSPIVKCRIPILNESKRGRPRKDQHVPIPGTSSQSNDYGSSSSGDVKPYAIINHEELMVEKITDILLKHNFQGKKGNPDIGFLVHKVRNMVRKGYIDDTDMSDDLTSSIARVLLPKQLSVPEATDIVCESINNAAAPDAAQSDEDTELITSDPTPTNYYNNRRDTTDEPETRTKRKAAIRAEKNIDSLAQDVVINLDDDDWDAGDTDFVPDQDEITTSNKGKRKSKNLTPSKETTKVVDTDESTLSADETRIPQANKYVVELPNITDKKKSNEDKKVKKYVVELPGITDKKKSNGDQKTLQKKPVVGPRKPKDRHLIAYHKEQKRESLLKPIDDPPSVSVTETPALNASEAPILNISEAPAINISQDIDYSSILLSDDDESAVKPTAKVSKVAKKLPVKPEIEEIVPLPMSLLKNQNFINIVAHTYLVGNPMLDEDAATLAAQYSTLKAYKEAEQTGKDVCSGPIYDIAVKVIGKEILKKMHSANPKAAASSANDAAATIQMKEQMIATQKTFEETAAKSAKSKSAKLREDMLQEKLGRTNQPEPVAAKPSTVVQSPANVQQSPASVNSTVVPVGFIKTCMRAGPSHDPHSTNVVAARAPRVECILPDHDDLIISDVRPAPAPGPAPAPAAPMPSLVPIAPAPPVISTSKPIVLNNVVYKPTTTRGYEAPLRVTVGNNASASTPQSVPPSKILLKPFANKNKPPVILNAQLSMTSPASSIATAPVIVPVSASTPVVLQQVGPGDATICLDSDDEEALVNHAQPSFLKTALSTTVLQQAPVPVSLTSAMNPGVKIPLTPISHLINQNQATTTAQKLVLRQVISADGTQAKYVLIPSDKLPMPVLNTNIPEPPKQVPAQPQMVPINTFNTAPGESLITPKKPEPQTNRAQCKPGDILRISKTGAIEVLSRSEINDINKTMPGAAPVDVDKTTPQYKTIAPKPDFSSIDLTNTTAPIPKQKPTTVFPPTPAPASKPTVSVDLTNAYPEVPKRKPGPKSQTVEYTKVPALAPPIRKPTTSASFDLTNTSSEVEKPKKATSQPMQSYKNTKKVEARKPRQISSSSSSSSSRPMSPENPLSILKDVIHIKAVDYGAGVPEAPVTLRTQKSKTSNISVQHVVSGESKKPAPESIKLTRVPRDQVPKHIDDAVKKEALLKKITPLLTKNQPKPVEEPKSRGKNTINFDNLSTAHTSKLLKSASKVTDKKSSTKTTKPSSSKTSDTVDLTNLLPPEMLIKPKSESKKRQSSSTETAPVKKKKPPPMTLKDFNLDDIDDIIELD